MTASTPHHPPGGNPQRIFLNADTVVDRPPTLFRVPAVKKQPVAPPQQLEPSQQLVIEQPLSPAASEFATTGAASGIPAASESIAPAGPFAAAGNPFPVAPPVGVASPLPGSGRPENPAAKSADKDKFAKPRPPAGGLPVPAGRSWMEGMGSRLVLLLLIGAVATVALLANRGSQPTDSDATLANLRLPLDEGSAPKKTADRNGADRNESGEPKASLEHAEIAADENAERQNTAANEPHDFGSHAHEGQSKSAAGPEPARQSTGAGSPRAAVPAFDLSGLQAANPETNQDRAAHDQRGRRELTAPAQSESFSVATRRFISEADRVTKEPQPASSNHDFTGDFSGSISPEDAIRAAVDAAVAGRGQPNAASAATSGAGAVSDSGYSTTDQPAGIDDWARYLPAAESGARATFDPNSPYNPNSPYGAPGSNTAPFGTAPLEGNPAYPTSSGGSLPAINPPRNPSESGQPGYATGFEGPEARTAQKPSASNPYPNNPYAGNASLANPYSANPYAPNSFSAGPQANSAPQANYGNAPYGQYGSNPYDSTSAAQPYPNAQQDPSTQYAVPSTQYPGTQQNTSTQYSVPSTQYPGTQYQGTPYPGTQQDSSTQYAVPSTQYPGTQQNTSTQYSVPSTQYPGTQYQGTPYPGAQQDPSTQYSVPSAQYPGTQYPNAQPYPNTQPSAGP